MTDIAHSEHVQRSKQSSIFRGCEFSRAEIEVAINDLSERAALLRANLQTLNENFASEYMVGIKLAAENISCVAGDAKKTASQVEALAASLARTFVVHLSRRAR